MPERKGGEKGRAAKRAFFVDLTKTRIPKKIKKQKNEFFYKKPLTNCKKGDKIVNCIIIARIADTLVKAAKCVIVILHKYRMSKRAPQPIVIFPKRIND